MKLHVCKPIVTKRAKIIKIIFALQNINIQDSCNIILLGFTTICGLVIFYRIIYPFTPLPLYPPQQFLYFFPLPQGQGSFLPTFCVIAGCSCFGADIISNTSENAFEQKRTVAEEYKV